MHAGLWVPFDGLDVDVYFRLRKRHGVLLTPNLPGTQAQLIFKQLFLSATLLSTRRLSSDYGPSGAWGLYVGTEARQFGLAPAIGPLFDDNGHARTLEANREMNITKQNQRITNRTQQAQSIKSDHCLTFNALYRVEQSKITGPVQYLCTPPAYAPIRTHAWRPASI